MCLYTVVFVVYLEGTTRTTGWSQNVNQIVKKADGDGFQLSQIKDVSIKTISKYFPMFYGTPCTFKSSSRKEWCMIKDFHRINCSVEDFVLLYFSLSLKKRKLLKIMNLPKLGYLNTFYQGKASFQVYRCESNMAFHDWRVNKYMFTV